MNSRVGEAARLKSGLWVAGEEVRPVFGRAACPLTVVAGERGLGSAAAEVLVVGLQRAEAHRIGVLVQSPRWVASEAEVVGEARVRLSHYAGDLSEQISQHQRWAGGQRIVA